MPVESISQNHDPTAAPISYLDYHNLSQVESKLHNIAVKHANITKVFELGQLYPHKNGTPKRTSQNRSVWALKISDNPGINESSEPEVLYMSLHHSREWISVEVLLYTMDYILDNYKTNSSLGNLVNNTELWFVPVVNPDGFYYSYEGRDDINQTNANQWRKNCNETNGISGFQDYNWARGDGVDLNRNYGYKWGYDNTGSSSDVNNQLYRGSAAFSEVETQLIRDLALDKDFKLAISYHSYSDLILFPYAYDQFDTNHDSLFNEIARNMSQYNNYQYGNTKDGVIYTCNGEASDWFYYNRSCLTFTFELHSSLFIPPTNQIIPICQKNLEPSLLIAHIADDPYKVVNSGVKGQVTDTQGKPIQGVNISSTYAGEKFETTTNETGHYRLRLPPGSFILVPELDGFWANSFGVGVIQDNYSLYDFSMEDIIAPIISQIWANDTTGNSSTYEIGANVQINIKEQYNETGLIGSIRIKSDKTSFNSGKQSLDFDPATKSYYFIWNTTNNIAADDYTVETTLKDFDQNEDYDGANNSGPDLILTLLDKAPPIISEVDSLSLDSGTTFDSDEQYEIGSTVRILVNELYGEKQLNGSVDIISELTGYNSTDNELAYNDSHGSYTFDWNTEGLLPSDDYEIETSLWDSWLNIDNDGIIETPDLVIILEDTTPPLIDFLDSFVGNDTDETYECGSLVSIMVKVTDPEPNLSGYLTIESKSAGFKANISDPKYEYDVDKYQFMFEWNTSNLTVANDYFIECRIMDSYHNFQSGGFIASGPDLMIQLVDTTAPSVSDVLSFVNSDNDNQYEIDSTILIMVKEATLEKDLTGTIIIESKSTDYTSGVQELDYDPELDGYVWQWNTMGLEPADDYFIETTLKDRFNNSDLDGKAAHPDLAIILEDTTPPQISSVWSMVGQDNDNDYELGSTVTIVVEERNSESGLEGEVSIRSKNTGYISEKLKLEWSSESKYYSYLWSSIGLKPSDDYSIETKIYDRYDNIDSNGIGEGPDLIIKLTDSKPPGQAENIKIKQDLNDLKIIELSWESQEDNATAIIYRNTKPIVSFNGLTPIIELQGNNYTDILSDLEGTYYYAVFLKDSNGNLNATITSGNTGSLELPSYFIDQPDDSDVGFSLLGLDLFNLIILIMIIIVIVFVITLIVIITRRKSKDSTRKSDGIKDPQSEYQSGLDADVYEDWSSYGNYKKDNKRLRSKSKSKGSISKRTGIDEIYSEEESSGNADSDIESLTGFGWKNPDDYDSHISSDDDFEDFEDYDEYEDNEEYEELDEFEDFGDEREGDNKDEDENGMEWEE